MIQDIVAVGLTITVTEGPKGGALLRRLNETTRQRLERYVSESEDQYAAALVIYRDASDDGLAHYDPFGDVYPSCAWDGLFQAHRFRENAKSALRQYLREFPGEEEGYESIEAAFAVEGEEGN